MKKNVLSLVAVSAAIALAGCATEESEAVADGDAMVEEAAEVTEDTVNETADDAADAVEGAADDAEGSIDEESDPTSNPIGPG